MKEASQERPLADPVYEKAAHEMFPMDISPEEYVARCGEDWLCCSFPSYSYRDARLDAWLQEFRRLNGSTEEVRELQRKFLTPEEFEEREEVRRKREIESGKP